MRLRRFVVPMAIVVVALLVIGGTAGLISAAYYAPSVVERPAETGGTPQEPEPVPTPTVAPKAPNEPLELAKAVELLVEPALLTEGSKRGSGQESVPSGDGEVYTWEDGDRTMRVVLQDNLVVQESTAVTPQDDVIRRGTKDSIVRKQAWHGPGHGSCVPFRIGQQPDDPSWRCPSGPGPGVGRGDGGGFLQGERLITGRDD